MTIVLICMNLVILVGTIIIVEKLKKYLLT